MTPAYFIPVSPISERKGTYSVTLCFITGDRWLELEFSSDENDNEQEDELIMDNNNGCAEELDGDNSDAEPMSNEALYFNKKHGSLIKLSCQKRTAERMHAMDEFNNGVVMTNRPLRNNEMFEVSH